jgi:NAD(P)-dependent dehydrogenase (short-subunit alcohol dehydrogenase family)
VRKAAAQITTIIHGGSLDLLFNNAGINISQRKLTEDGIERQFATNHVGPFLLTNLVMSLLVKGGGRVVNVSSEAHRISPVRFSDWNLEPRKEVPVDEEPRRGMPEGILRGGGGYVISSCVGVESGTD